MSNYFPNSQDLKQWILQKKSPEDAARKLEEVVSLHNPDADFSSEHNIQEACDEIFTSQRDDVAENLFGILAKHNVVMTKTSSSNIVQTAQSVQSRQRNKWNRTIEGYNDGTPWRRQRDQMYDKTHYATDEITFDADPDRVYSGEALWRTYIMDKYYREYKNDEGKYVGGYINDRFYVFPDAGTPDNPDVPRDGGNPMGLPVGIKSRQPRPSEYSTERRLEEARGNELTSLKSSVAKKLGRRITLASTKVPEEAYEDDVFQIYRDSLEMHGEGFSHGDIVLKIAEHYEKSPLEVSQIVSHAKRSLEKHAGVGYAFKVAASAKNPTHIMTDDISAKTMDGNVVKVEKGSLISYDSDDAYYLHDLGRYVYFIKDPTMNMKPLDQKSEKLDDFEIQEVSREVGL